MQTSPTYSKTQLRELASLVSHAAFKKLSTSSNQSAYIRRMKRYINWENLAENKPAKLGDLIAYSYNLLEQHYRHEYIYKNKLLNDYVLRYYALEDTVLLNEFRIGQSIADAVLINGTNKVFEIKTELDTPERLYNQLADYYKVFTEVYLFTHASLLDKYLRVLPAHVGVLVYTEEGQVSEYRRSQSYSGNLDPAFMMASLRKSEYTELVKRLVGFIPSATPAFFYRSCLAILQQLPVEEVRKSYCDILKGRINSQTNLYLSEGEIPTYLNFSFYQQKFDKKSYLTIVNNLSKNLL